MRRRCHGGGGVVLGWNDKSLNSSTTSCEDLREQEQRVHLLCIMMGLIVSEQRSRSIKKEAEVARLTRSVSRDSYMILFKMHVTAAPTPPGYIYCHKYKREYIK